MTKGPAAFNGAAVEEGGDVGGGVDVVVLVVVGLVLFSSRTPKSPFSICRLPSCLRYG